MKALLLSAIVGAVILAVIIQSSNISNLSEKITGASVSWIVLSFGLFISLFFLRSVRWKIITGKGKFLNLFCIVQIGYLLNNILPFHLNEPIRAVLLKEKEGIDVGYGLSSIALEKLMDIIGLLTLGVIVAALFPVTNVAQAWMFDTVTKGAIVAAIIISALIIFTLRPNIFVRIIGPLHKIRYVNKLSAKLQEVIINAANGMKIMSNKPFNIVFSFLMTLAIWIVNFIGVYLLFVAINFEIDPFVVLLGFTGSTLLLAIPSSPGYIGTYEAFWMGAFFALGYKQYDEILAVGIISHGMFLVVTTVLGVIGLVILRLPFKDLLSRRSVK
ncbi:MAG: lysylphosphatidylglycerol synthase transmembrane domain-containing protein [Nitrososphaerales archaeon]